MQSSSGHGFGFETPFSEYRLESNGPASIAFRTAHLGADEGFKSGLPFIDGLPPSATRPSALGLIPGTIMELYGPAETPPLYLWMGTIGSGKTEVVLNIIASYIMPKRLEGREGSVIFLDLDFRLNIARVQALVRAKLGSEDDADGTLLRECLARVLIARCFDEVDILATLESIRGEARSGEPMLLVIDSLASLHYSTKLAESCRSERTSLHNSIYRAIGRLASQNAATVLAVKPCLLVPKRLHDDLGPYLEHRDYMPRMWKNTVTHRVDLLKEDCVDETAVALDPTTILVRITVLQPPPATTGTSSTSSTVASSRHMAFRFRVGPEGCEHCEDLQAAEQESSGPQ